jgi:hypothetical protein
MHISRSINHPESRPERRRSERGVVVAVIMFALLALGGALWLGQNGAAPCGEESLTTTCGMP